MRLSHGCCFCRLSARYLLRPRPWGDPIQLYDPRVCIHRKFCVFLNRCYCGHFYLLTWPLPRKRHDPSEKTGLISRFDNTQLNRLGNTVFWKFNLPVLLTKSVINSFNSNQIKLLNSLIYFFFMYGFSVQSAFKTKFFSSGSNYLKNNFKLLNFNYYYRTLGIKTDDFSDSFDIYIRRQAHLTYPLTLWFLFYDNTFIVIWFIYRTHKSLKRRRRFSKPRQNPIRKYESFRSELNLNSYKYINYKNF